MTDGPEKKTMVYIPTEEQKRTIEGIVHKFIDDITLIPHEQKIAALCLLIDSYEKMTGLNFLETFSGYKRIVNREDELRRIREAGK